MRKFYLCTLSYLQTKLIQGLAIALVLLSLQMTSNAQVSTWNGSISSDVLTTDNWTPAVTITGTATTAGPHITVPRTPMKPGNILYDHPPIITGAANYAVRSLGGATVANTVGTNDSVDLDGDLKKETFLSNSKFIVNLDEGYTFTVQNGTTATSNANWYPGGTMIIKSGKMYTTRPIYLTADSQTIIVQNKGIFQTTATCVMGSNNGYLTATNGGRLVVKENGKILLGGWQGRTTDSLKGPQIFVTENGTVEVNGQVDFNPHIRKLKITGGSNYYPVTRIDIGANKTYIWAVPNNELRVAQTANQILTAGVAGTLVSVVQNQAWKDCDPASFQWKYGTSPTGPFVAFSSPVLNDSIIPNFNVSGTLYLVCQATKISDGSTLTTDAVKCIVGSGKLVFTPSATQYLRVGQSGAPISVSETGTSTGREWKYSTVSGGPYQSFAAPETGVTYTPSFTEADTFYIQLESTIDGNIEKGKEITIINDLWTAGARSLNWVGTSSVITNAANWNPIAYIHRNTLTVPTGVANMPILQSSGNDTINSVAVGANTKFIVNKPSLSDTLDIRNDNQNIGDGTIEISSGVVKATAGLRLVSNASKISISGNSVLLFRGGLGLSLGNANTVTAGGKVVVSGNGKIIHDVGPYRVSSNKNDSLSRTIIKGNGQAWYINDQYNTVYNWIKLNKLFQDTSKTDTLAFIYEAVSNYTRVWAFDTLAPCVVPFKRIYAGKNQPVQLSARNAGALHSFEWLYRKNVNDGKNFDLPEAWTTMPGATGTDVSVSFPESGDYFVTWVAKDGSNNTVSAENVAKIKVVAIDIVDIKDTIAKPKINVIVGFEGKVLLRNAPLKSLGEWKWATSAAGPFVSYDPAQTDTVLNFLAAELGSTFVVYETTVNNDDASPVVVYSSPVEVEVVTDINVKPLDGTNIVVYPTITSGAFTIKTAGAGKVSVQVIDVTGKVVLNKKYDTSGNIHLNYPVKGSYIVKVVSAKGVKVTRLVVK